MSAATAPRNDRLIFDIGTSEGNDTSFYLRKGFDVVAVEADPVTQAEYRARFAAEIAAGRLTALHRAAAGRAGQALTFWRNDKDQGVSSLQRNRKQRYAHTQSSYEVGSTDWSELVAIRGIPHYAKIDVEGGEVDFLGSIAGREVAPRYLSAEAKTLDVVEAMAAIGYRRFRIVCQKAIRYAKPHQPPLEGLFLDDINADHGSGLFGRELPGETWLDLAAAREALRVLLFLHREGLIVPTWYDCHATLDDAA